MGETPEQERLRPMLHLRRNGKRLCGRTGTGQAHTGMCPGRLHYTKEFFETAPDPFPAFCPWCNVERCMDCFAEMERRVMNE